MTQILANHNKNRPHTHRVTVEFTLPANSNQHAEMIAKNCYSSAFKKIINISIEQL